MAQNAKSLDGVLVKKAHKKVKFTEKELKGESLTRAELNYSKLCSAYLYLLKVVEKHELLDEEDNPFTPETLH